MHEAEHSKPVLWDNPEGWGGEGRGRGVQDGEVSRKGSSGWGDTCVPMADSCLCMAKAII